MGSSARAATPPQTNLPDDDAVIAVNLGKIRDARGAVDAAGNTYRTVLKHAEGKGVHLKAAARALAIVKSGDADEWLAETSAITRYLKILRHGVQDSQLDLAFESPLAPIEEKAALDGRAVGLDTSPDAIEEKNPHALNTRAGQAWLTAFRQGRSERDIILSMKDDVPAAGSAAADERADDDEDWSNMIVAGFDLATVTGFAILDGARVLRADAYRAKGNTDAEVFTDFRAWFRGLLKASGVQRVAIEEPLRTPMLNQSRLKRGEIELSPKSNMSAYLKLYGFRAIAIQSVIGLGLPEPLEVNQMTWRKSFTGNGRATKEDSVALARQIVPGLISEDAAEAIGVAWHLNGVLRTEQQLARAGDAA